MTPDWLKNILASMGKKPAVAERPVFRPENVKWSDRDKEKVSGYAHLRQQEARWVEKLIKKTKRSPTGRAALAWAEAHDIRFEITHQFGIRGAYKPSSGTIFLRQSDFQVFSSDPATLVHEIRHAWQDYHGLIPSQLAGSLLTVDIGRQLIQQALLEADAEAHGQMVNRELRRFGRRLADPKGALTKGFIKWFADRAPSYHQLGVRRFRWADRHYVAAEQRAVAANQGGKSAPSPNFMTGNTGIDPWQRSAIEQLGRSFSGVNYLTGLTAEDRGYMRRLLLTPEKALAAFNPNAKRASYKYDENNIRKKQIRIRLKTPMKRLPLPDGVAV